MRNPLGLLLYLVIGYILGSVFEPSLFPTDLRAVNWYNREVWFWVIGWPVMLLLLVFPEIPAALNRPR